MKESIHLISTVHVNKKELQKQLKQETYVVEAQHQDRSYRAIVMYTSGNFLSKPL
jgi:hypothetical protein